MKLNTLLNYAQKPKVTQPFKFGMFKDTRSAMDYVKPQKNKRLSKLMGM